MILYRLRWMMKSVKNKVNSSYTDICLLQAL